MNTQTKRKREQLLVIKKKENVLYWRIENGRGGEEMSSHTIYDHKISAEEETERKRRLHRCAFTGHRPEKLQKPESVVKAELRHEIIGAVHDGFSVFISGMARGVDIWAAELVLDLKKEFRDIKLICAIPYAGFELRWSEEWQARYRTILSHAD